MKLYSGILFMKRIPGMPRTSPESPWDPGDPRGTALGHMGTPLGPPGTPLGTPGTPRRPPDDCCVQTWSLGPIA